MFKRNFCVYMCNSGWELTNCLPDRWWLQMRETSHMVKFLISIFLSLFSIVNHSQKSKLSFWITLSLYLSEVMIHHTFKNVLKITGCQCSRLCNVIRLQSISYRNCRQKEALRSSPGILQGHQNHERSPTCMLSRHRCYR